MRVVTLPGAFRPRSDTWMLAAELAAAVRRRPGRPRVLDVGTGSGTLATVAALAGADVTAIDLSRRALASARATAAANGVAVRTLRGDLLAPVAGERFDVVVSNPPYVPAPSEDLPSRGPARATDAGHDGRVVLDRLCDAVASVLAPGGEVLLIHSSVNGIAPTLTRLHAAGLEADVALRHRGPLGPLLTQRRSLLVARGLLPADAQQEEVVIVCAQASSPVSPPSAKKDHSSTTLPAGSSK